MNKKYKTKGLGQSTDELARPAKVRELELGALKKIEAFSLLTSLVTKSLGCSKSMIRIVGDDAQLLPGKLGFDHLATPCGISIGSVCFASQSPLLIEDAAIYARFANNALASDTPNVWSYLSVPLLTVESVVIDARRVMSATPHAFIAADVETLQSFASLGSEAILARVQTVQPKHANAHVGKFQPLFRQAETAFNMGSGKIDSLGKPAAVVGMIRDFTEKRLNTPFHSHASERDELTELLNRSAFDKLVHEMFAAVGEAIFTVALIDVDAFKDVNDVLGYHAGDRLLSVLGKRLREICDLEIHIARWGGDEFSIWFPRDTLLEDASIICMQLVKLLSNKVILGDNEITVDVTCGIAQVDKTKSPEDLIRRADVALRFGKEHQRGSVHCWNENLDGASTMRQRAIHTLQSAFAEGRAFAAYQPIVGLENGRVVGVEALLRLSDGAGGVLTASDVFFALTEPHMSRRVSRFMIEQVLKDGPQILQRYGDKCQIGLNVSEADLRAPNQSEDFVGLITRLTLKSALRPQNVTLEITETMLLSDEDGYIRDGLCALDRLGYTIALDDFGTGYSSLTHLRDFPIQKVKIDKEFVSAISSDHQSRMIIQAIVQMSRSLGLEVIAEGVENANEEAFLRAVGCQYAQGFRYGKPKSISGIAVDGQGG